MKMNLHYRLSPSRRSREAAPRRMGRNARAGFTLIEIMVALAILMLMMAIIFVPLNLGTRFFAIGNARSHVQQAAQLTINQIASDLHQAIYVYPNDVLPGVTTNSPYTNNPISSGIGAPYYQSTSQAQVFVYSGSSATPNSIVCGSHTPVGNTSRIDFILPKTPNDVSGAAPSNVPYTPMTAAPYLVTYYARRLDPTTSYDAVDNPIVLFRAQCPPYIVAGGTVGPSVDLSSGRYPTSSCSSNNDRTSAWLAQSMYGEPDLGPLASDGKATATGSDVVGDHLLITPRGMGLLAPHALDDKAEPPVTSATLSYVPDTTFVCEDTNGDGKIDRVRINLTLAEFDSDGASATPQTVRLSETVDLPNIR